MPTRLEQAVIVLAALAVAAKVAVAAGMPSAIATALRLVTATTAVAATFRTRSEKGWIDGPRLFLILLALYYLPSVYPRVGGDGIEYYVQARSLFFDWDLDFENDYRGLGAEPVRSAQEEITSRFPVGLPLFWIPPLLVTHIGATLASWLGAGVETNGFSPVYQASVTVATYVYGFLALLLLESALRPRHGRAVALLVVVAVWLATPLHFYMVANPFMSHGLSVLLATCFVLSWMKARGSEGETMWVVTGALGGLMALVRVQDGVLLLLPLVDLALTSRARHVQLMGKFLAGPLICGILQATIWLYLYGGDFIEVVFFHGKIGRTFPHGIEFLFSPRHGLLTWTPLYVGALIGWGILLKRSARLGLAIWLAFMAAIAINSSTGDWWGSESFGQRRMLSMIPLFALGLAETFDYLKRRPLLPLGLAVGALVLWNLQLAYIYNAELVSRRDQAATLDRVMAAQMDVLYRRLLRSHEWMPRGAWVLLYDNLKGVWLDEGSRSLGGRVDLGNEPEGYYPLVGDGWFPPQKDGNVDYRLSRARRSWLTFPIRRPADSRIVMRARPEMSEVPVQVRLDVNGRNVGEEELSPGWSEYIFDVPKDLFRPGLNRIILTYSATPRMVIPGFHGKNAAIAVDWLELR